jgi:hypothetical protein
MGTARSHASSDIDIIHAPSRALALNPRLMPVAVNSFHTEAASLNREIVEWLTL